MDCSKVTTVVTSVVTSEVTSEATSEATIDPVMLSSEFLQTGGFITYSQIFQL